MSSYNNNNISRNIVNENTGSFIDTCNTYAMYIGYITVLLIGYWLFSLISGLFSKTEQKPNKKEEIDDKNNTELD